MEQYIKFKEWLQLKEMPQQSQMLDPKALAMAAKDANVDPKAVSDLAKKTDAAKKMGVKPEDTAKAKRMIDLYQQSQGIK